MARITFQRDMDGLQAQLLELGSMVAETIQASVAILKNRDIDAAHQLVQNDNVINKKRYAVESETLILIARQQPMAVDLRTLAAFLEIATELERIADYSKGIARITIQLADEPFVKPLIDIPRMAEKAADMLNRALISFQRRDIEMAKDIACEDHEMDQLYQQVYRELMTYVLVDPRNIEGGSHLIWVAHKLERAADRVVNICERVIFTVTGELIELDDASRNAGPCSGH